jgi:rare lipoprotein A
MNPAAMTAAHKTLPFGTKLKVIDQVTGNSIVVTINDRGPFIKGRIIDLSKAAASELGIRGRGHTKVCIAQI